MKYSVTWSEALLFWEDVEASSPEEAKELALQQVYGKEMGDRSGDDIFQSASDSEVSTVDVEEVECCPCCQGRDLCETYFGKKCEEDER
jgi:hypothetical protein